MKMLTKAQEEQLVREAYENFPEASTGSSLVCTGWKYQLFVFNFIDGETGKKYTVTLPKAIKGLRLLLKAVLAGELKGLGLPLDITDTGNWDATGFDALAQMAVFGKVIYG